MSGPAFTPAEMQMLVSSSPTANGSFHLYLADEGGRKVAALWGGNDEKMANGYLWSAAPELYAALEAVTIFAAATIEKLRLEDTNGIVAAANAALAKARGEVQ